MTRRYGKEDDIKKRDDTIGRRKQSPGAGAERRSCLVRLLSLPIPLNRDLEIDPGLGVCEAEK